MNTQQVADRLVELCRDGKNMQALDELYADDIVSTEMCAGPEMPKEMKGIEAIRGKSRWWYENHIVHSGTTEGPLVAGAFFSVAFKYDITMKANNQRFMLEEIAVYRVKDGKIITEQFFYPME
ncbi:MAG: nuclear transport factor 2 family protein [Burkholderiales bacterium]|nr:nuclear transport factor 2 family protein [Phycisphaerae bacterium]